MANHTVNATTTDTAGATTTVTAAVGPFDTGDLFWWRMAGTLVAIVATWVIVKISDRTLTRSAGRLARLRHLDEQRTRAAVGRTKPMRFVVRIVLLAVLIITILGIWGLRTAFTGLLAGAGFAGIVVGLAAADTIGDIIAGFLIFYNHPFDIGDWVEVDGTEGIVEDVSLGATTLLTFDNEKVTFPNRIIEGGRVRNFSHARKLRRRLTVGVEYGSDLALARQTLLDLARSHPEIFATPEPSVVSKGFGASSVDLELRFYVEPVRSSAIKVFTDLVEAVHDTFRAKGIVIAFPHVQVVQARPWQVHAEAGGSADAGAYGGAGGGAGGGGARAGGVP